MMNHTIKLNSQDIHKFKEQMKQQEKLEKRIHLIFFFSCILFVFVLLAKYSPALYNGENFDHELFMYLQNKNWILATSDKRWIRIAEEVCPKNLLDLALYK